MSALLLTVILMGLVTFALRFCFFGPLSTDSLPRDVESALPYIMPAALMAIIVPDVIFADSATTIWLTPYVVGAAVGFAVGTYKRDNLWLTVIAAMLAFIVSSYLLQGI